MVDGYGVKGKFTSNIDVAKFDAGVYILSFF